MTYSYNKLWKLLIDKNMMKKDLMAKTKIKDLFFIYTSFEEYYIIV